MSDVAVTGTTSSAASETSKTGSLLGGIGQLGSAAVGALDSLFGFSARRQYRLQKNLMNEQQDLWKEQQEILNQQALDQWNRENEYNDPTNAYKRLLNGAEANGISKAAALGLLGGNGGGVQTTAASGAMPTASTALPSASGAPYQSIGQGVMNSMRQMAEINLIDAQTEATYADAGLKGTQKDYYAELAVTTTNLGNLYIAQEATEKQKAESLRLQNIGQEINNRTLSEKNKAELTKLWKEVDLVIEQAGLTKSNKEYREKEYGTFDRRFDAQMRQAAAEYKLTLAKTYAERMLGSDHMQSARYRSITNKELDKRYKEELRRMKIENDWLPLMNYKRSIPDNYVHIPYYVFSGDNPEQLAKYLLTGE